jgi:hypothetical protein
MAPGARAWFTEHRMPLARALIFVLLAVIALQAYALYHQGAMNRAATSQSDKLLASYMRADTLATPSAASVHLRLRNVRFEWSDKVYIDTDDMAVRAEPLRGSVVNFDDPQSFVMAIQHSAVEVSPQVLEGMFNESVFNYPGSTLRDLKLSLAETDSARAVHVKGSVNVVVWVPFSMDAYLSVDPASNALAIDVRKLKVLGFLPAMKLIKWGPFHLDKLIPAPPNQSLEVHDNRILVRPFALFPPPRVSGRIASVSVGEQSVRIVFAGDPIPSPSASTATNYVYLHGGTSEFGSFRMAETDILVADAHPSDRFAFSLAHYAELLPRSRVDLADSRSVRVTMPDH